MYVGVVGVPTTKNFYGNIEVRINKKKREYLNGHFVFKIAI